MGADDWIVMRLLSVPLGPITCAGELALSIFDGIDSATVCVFDNHLRYVMTVGGALDRHGWKAELMEGRLVEEALGADIYGVLGPHYEAALTGETSKLDWTAVDGSAIYALTFLPLHGEQAEIIGGMVVLRDITQARTAELALAAAQKRATTAFENAPVGMALIGMDWTMLKVNRALCEVTGRSREELTRADCRAALHPDDAMLDRAQVVGLIRGEIDSYEIEKRYFTACGKMIWLLHAVTFMPSDGDEPAHLIVQVIDVSERKRQEATLYRLADHDDLTGLWNRRRFQKELVEQVRRCRRHGERTALLMLDLDHFKEVNDTLGHKVGDDLIRAVAEAMKGVARSSDILARLGGDEFAVLLTDVSPDQAAALAEDFSAAIRDRAVTIGGTCVRATASIGIAFMDETVASDQEVLIQADVAMYAAKAAGRNRTKMLPRSPVAPLAAADPHGDLPAAPRLRVVHCDDSEPYRRLIAEMLGGHHGIDVVAGVATYRQAIARAAQLAPDVVLLDASVSESDDVIPALRRVAPESRIVVLSGMEKDRIEHLRGADDFVAKTASFEDLAQLIRAGPERCPAGPPSDYQVTGRAIS